MRIRTIVAAIATFTLGMGVLSQATAARDEPHERASARVASKALADARAVLDNDPATGVTDGRDASLVLRDLLKVRNQLTGADRAAADRILGRPTDSGDDDSYGGAGESTCGTYVCVHWIETGRERILDTTDADLDGVPNYVESVRDAMDHVHATYAAAGYRAPVSDGTDGGNAKPDVYLAQIGNKSLYGYCAPEGRAPRGGPWDLAAYCVLDNDYSHGEFPTNTPTENMQVTAAHEYFHAVQFAYDAYEDRWFMEATATWAEDEVYDSVNDNLNYLPLGQLGRPDLPLDRSYTNGNHYGNWIFFRYLTEKYGASQGGMPTLVRDMWRRADGATGGRDQFGLQAVVNTVGAAGGNFTKLYAGFADGNRRPARVYDEGKAQRYPTAPLYFRAMALSPTSAGTSWGTLRLDHLTSAAASFKPKKTTAKQWKLKVQVDMASRSRGSVAVVSVYSKNGTVRSSFISLNAKGKGAKNVPFSSTKVSRVDLVLVNASTRGKPDDNLTQKLRVTAHR